MDNNHAPDLPSCEAAVIQPVLTNVATGNPQAGPGVLRQIATWRTMMEVVAGMIPGD
ncbi:hypothetical protein [Paracoccus onubensis]|uniref:hypothetical protein n=1 Tax=Paracoccus onubensis TaxID=1675788 RepID=UPI0016026F40|nr:hypothetical protein [Paracoccus onubensis]